MTRHLEDGELIRLSLGQLADGEAQGAREHLVDCEVCSDRHRSLSSDAFAPTVPGAADDTRALPVTRPERPGATALARGATLGRYVILEKLGAGGMGDVYAAYDPQLDRKVAVKLLRGDGELTADEGQARLLREAQAMARLQHPNVIAVHDVGTLDHRVFIAMEFVDGETITEWLRGPRTWRQILELFRDAGQGLSAAHRAGLVHRDFKPDNVLVGADGRPRVMDFGLAREAGPPGDAATPTVDLSLEVEVALRKRLTRDGAILGTPGYMAPEQLTGAGVEASSDQFSFCVALYEALYGRRPFTGDTLKAQLAEVTQGRVAPPPEDTAVPRWVLDAISRGLAAEPSRRWPDMDALLRALEGPRPRARRRGAVVAVAVVAGLAAVGLWIRGRMLVCGGQERALAGVWDTAARAQLARAFGKAQVPFAGDALSSVQRTMDSWALGWTEAARDACLAARVRRLDSEELYQLKRRCLDERLDQARSLLTLFSGADREVVLNAPAAARALEPASSCVGRAAAAAVPDEKERADAEALRATLGRAEVLFTAGKYEDAAALLRPALARSAPHRVAAEAWLVMGRIELKRGDWRTARDAHLHAAEHALKASDDRLEALALSRLYANEGYDEDDADAEVLGRLAQAAASRVAADWEVQVELARNEALVQIRRRRFKAALVDLERSLALQREHLPAEHPEIAVSLNNLGIVLTRMGRVDDAIRLYRESLDIHRAVEGPLHPNTATSAHNLAVTYRSVGQLTTARTHLEDALVAREAALGLTHPDTLSSRLVLARVLTSLGELERAGELLAPVVVHRQQEGTAAERGAAVEAQAELFLAMGTWSAALAQGVTLAMLAERGPAMTQARLIQLKALVGLGELAAARRILAELESAAEPSDARLAAELAEARARLALGLGRRSDARAALELASTLREQVGPPPRLAAVLVELARLHLEQGNVEVARQALAHVDQVLRGVDAPLELARAELVRLALTAHDGGTVDAGSVTRALERLPGPSRQVEASWLTGRGVPAGP